MSTQKEMLTVLRDVAALLPASARLHPKDLYALQTRVCAAIAKAEAEVVPIEQSRWCCPSCKSRNVQISFPTWYRESKDFNLEYVEVDGEADILWWYCEDCDESDSGAPEEIEEVQS